MERANSRKNSTYIVVGVGLLFIILIMVNQISNQPTNYQTQIRKERAAKDLQFKNDPTGPIPREARKTFDKLAYFPPQEAYLVPFERNLPSQRDTIYLPNTKGGQDAFLEAGQIVLTLQEKTYQLRAFEYLTEETPTLFVPFSDQTSGESTYGGGRYLDIPLTQPYEVDFNQAYNPYCVYNPNYTCPLPPPENHLDIAVEAGEKNYINP
ncbi:MAG: DUF1684 domain-containing protein [Bacteroidota bacterium]